MSLACVAAEVVIEAGVDIDVDMLAAMVADNTRSVQSLPISYPVRMNSPASVVRLIPDRNATALPVIVYICWSAVSSIDAASVAAMPVSVNVAKSAVSE